MPVTRRREASAFRTNEVSSDCLDWEETAALQTDFPAGRRFAWIGFEIARIGAIIECLEEENVAHASLLCKPFADRLNNLPYSSVFNPLAGRSSGYHSCLGPFMTGFQSADAGAKFAAYAGQALGRRAGH